MRKFVFPSLLLLLLCFPALTSAANFNYTKIFYYTEGKNARASLYKLGKKIDILAPQIYSLNDTGDLSGSINPDVLSFAQRAGIKVMPLVTNSSFNRTHAHIFLDSVRNQKRAITALLKEADKNNYSGYQIDFEQMDAVYRDDFTAFIKRLHTAFAKKKLLLSVAVVAEFSENPSDYKNTLWNDLIGVYDYKKLSDNADFVSIMSYDDPDSKGPVARFSWLRSVLSWSLKCIPKEKISMGLGLYYWQWRDLTGKRVGVGGNEGIQNAINNHNVTYHYSTEQQAPYMTYKSLGRKYTLWYENGKSVEMKINLLKSFGLHGFSAWALGLEVPSVLKIF